MHYEINPFNEGKKNFSFNAGTKHDKYTVTTCMPNKLKQKETPINFLHYTLYKSNRRSHNPQEILIKITTLQQ